MERGKKPGHVWHVMCYIRFLFLRFFSITSLIKSWMRGCSICRGRQKVKPTRSLTREHKAPCAKTDQSGVELDSTYLSHLWLWHKSCKTESSKYSSAWPQERVKLSRRGEKLKKLYHPLLTLCIGDLIGKISVCKTRIRFFLLKRIKYLF